MRHCAGSHSSKVGRNFWLSLFLILVVVGLPLATGCAEKEAAPTSKATPVAVPTGLAKPSGELKVAVSDFYGENLDPIVGSYSKHATLGAPFDWLIEVTPNAKLAPGIAERWEVSADGLTYTFYIRKGVKFHDGSDLTGADVKFSLERFTSKESTSSRVTIFRRVIKTVELRDPFTVIVNLAGPEADFLAYMTILNGQEGMVMPKNYIEAKGADYFARNPVGSGPWKFVRATSGVSMEFEAVEGHWRKTPEFKTLKLMLVPDEATVLAMLRTGELDMASINPDAVQSAKSAGLNIMPVPGPATVAVILFYGTYLDPNMPTADVRVRKAMELAINKDEIIKGVLQGYGEPRRGAMTSPVSYWYNPEVNKLTPYDPNQAKQVLNEAGYPNGFDVEFHTPTIPGAPFMQSISEAAEGYWRRIGVRATFVPSDYAAFQQLYRAVPMSPKLVGRPATFRSTAPYVSRHETWFGQKGTLRLLNSPELEKLLDDFYGAANMQSRIKVLNQMDKLLDETYVAIGIADVQNVYAAGKSVASWKPIDGMAFNNRNLETVVRAK